MGKSKLIIMQGLEPEPSTATQLYLMAFQDLEAKLVDMDAIMKAPMV
jgi:hypothetical protein